MGKKKLPQKLLDWVEARKRHSLSHAHVQMARELGMNPKKLGIHRGSRSGEGCEAGHVPRADTRRAGGKGR